MAIVKKTLEQLNDQPQGAVDAIVHSINALISENVRNGLKQLLGRANQTHLIEGADVNARANQVKQLFEFLKNDQNIQQIAEDARNAIHGELNALHRRYPIGNDIIDIGESLESVKNKLRPRTTPAPQPPPTQPTTTPTTTPPTTPTTPPAPQVPVVQGASNALVLGTGVTGAGIATASALPWAADLTGGLTFPSVNAGTIFNSAVTGYVGYKAGDWLANMVPGTGKGAKFARGSIRTLGAAGGASLGLSAPLAPYVSLAALAGAGAAGLYGLGRLDRWAWGSPGRPGALGTMLRGAATPVTLPLRVLNKVHEWAWGAPMADSKWKRALLGPGAFLTVPTGIAASVLGATGRAIAKPFKGLFSGFAPQQYQPKGTVENVFSVPGRVVRWPFRQIGRFGKWLFGRPGQ